MVVVALVAVLVPLAGRRRRPGRSSTPPGPTWMRCARRSRSSPPPPAAGTPPSDAGVRDHQPRTASRSRRTDLAARCTDRPAVRVRRAGGVAGPVRSPSPTAYDAALSAENRNRIRFEMRREVSRSRRQRRQDIKEARRHLPHRPGVLAARRGRRMSRALWFAAGAGVGRLRDHPGPPGRRGVHPRGPRRPAGGAVRRGCGCSPTRSGPGWPRRKTTCVGAPVSRSHGHPTPRAGRARDRATREGND